MRPEFQAGDGGRGGWKTEGPRYDDPRAPESDEKSKDAAGARESAAAFQAQWSSPWPTAPTAGAGVAGCPEHHAPEQGRGVAGEREGSGRPARSRSNEPTSDGSEAGW